MSKRLAPLDLDRLYGEALPPQRIESIEREAKPKSLHKLDPASAVLLKQLVDITARGLGVTQFVYNELPILWVVDKSGDLWFALEEFVSESTYDYVRPRLRNLEALPGTVRIGHPSLIAGREGRIGGEILFDHALDDGTWVITNLSGRYGLRPGRTAQHLDNAARCFIDLGILLVSDFTPPRVHGVL